MMLVLCSNIKTLLSPESF